MKRQFFAIPLLLISFCFFFSNNTLAAGQACCSNYSTYNASSNLCVPQYGGPSQAINCGTGEACVGSTCVSTVTPSVSGTGNIQLGATGVTMCGDVNEKCCNGTCNGNLICSFAGGPNEACLRKNDVYTVGKNETFCIQDDRDSGIMTAIGCINTDSTNSFVTSILRVITGIGGGIALVLILYGVFVVTTSAGMPDKLKAGGEVITSAIIGLIFILLSVFLMNLIGINILGLPGLS